jgi:hypothetical protein
VSGALNASEDKWTFGMRVIPGAVPRASVRTTSGAKSSFAVLIVPPFSNRALSRPVIATPQQQSPQDFG